MRIRFDNPFYQRLYILSGVLAVGCLLLAGLLIVQGPRIRMSNVDEEALVAMPNQRVILHANQALGTITSREVSISPKTDYQVKASGSIVLVQFTKPLSYGTHYTITIKPRGLRDVRYNFDTPKPLVYYMHRASDDTGDKILSREVGSNVEDTIFSAKNITEFTALSKVVLVSVRSANFTDTLYRIDTSSGAKSVIKLPGQGIVSHLMAAPNKQNFGFVFTSKQGAPNSDSTLYIGDISTGKTFVARSFDKKPLQVLNWGFGQDSYTILSQLFDNSTLLTNTNSGTPPVPLGQLGLGGISYDGSTGFFTDAQGPLKLNIASNKQERLPQVPIGKQSFAAHIMPFNTHEGYLMNGQVFYDVNYEGYAEYVVIGHGQSQTSIFIGSPKQTIASTTLSQNDEYAAVETLETANGSSKRQTKVFNLRTGKSTDISNASLPVFE